MPASRQTCYQLAPAPAKQRANQRDIGPRSNRPAAHPGEATNPTAAGQAHEQGFSLIVGMVRGGERIQPALLGPKAE